jgi:hypothetical protein
MQQSMLDAKLFNFFTSLEQSSALVARYAITASPRMKAECPPNRASFKVVLPN